MHHTPVSRAPCPDGPGRRPVARLDGLTGRGAGHPARDAPGRRSHARQASSSAADANAARPPLWLRADRCTCARRRARSPPRTVTVVPHRTSSRSLTRRGPATVTFAARLGSLDRPSDLAERLPKALIHRNVPGEAVHAFLRDFDRAWAAAAPYAALSARQRWVRAVHTLRADWPLVDGPRRWRQGEVTVRWEALAPRDG